MTFYFHVPSPTAGADGQLNICEHYTPAWSPDGEHIAFSGLLCDGNQEILVMDTDGELVINVSGRPSRDVAAVWSPDGKRLAFIADNENTGDLFVVDPDATHALQLTDTPANEFSQQWSPDGKQLVYVSQAENQQGLFLIDAADPDSSPLQLTDNTSQVGCPVWSPDGLSIAFWQEQTERTSDIFLLPMDTLVPANLTRSDQKIGCPAWSSDGQQIAFGKRTAIDTWQLWTMDADGMNQRPLITETFGAIFGLGLEWSPSGTQIALTYTSGMLSHLGLVPTDGSDIIWISNGDGRYSSPSWSPDGTQLVFEADSEAFSNIYRVNADGTDKTRLTGMNNK
jgi:TolB protein